MQYILANHRDEVTHIQQLNSELRDKLNNFTESAGVLTERVKYHDDRKHHVLIPVTLGSESLGSQPFLQAHAPINQSQGTLIESADYGRRSILELENRDLSQKVI
jgi:hypothetical protein